jgi:hypothetical protein
MAHAPAYEKASRYNAPLGTHVLVFDGGLHEAVGHLTHASDRARNAIAAASF